MNVLKDPYKWLSKYLLKALKKFLLTLFYILSHINTIYGWFIHRAVINLNKDFLHQFLDIEK